MSLRSENKISKVSQKEAIYGLTRQILSKTKAECRRRLRFLIAVILCYIKINKYRIWVCGAKTKLAKFHTRKPIYGQTRQILSKTETEGRRRLQFPIAGILCYIKKNKCKNLSLWSEKKISKVSHNETIYGQTRQILSKTRTEGRRKVRFLIAIILCFIKKINIEFEFMERNQNKQSFTQGSHLWKNSSNTLENWNRG